MAAVLFLLEVGMDLQVLRQWRRVCLKLLTWQLEVVIFSLMLLALRSMKVEPFATDTPDSVDILDA